MKRTTVSFPSELLARAEKVAARRRVSLGAVVREALRSYLDGDAGWEAPRSLGFADSGGKGRGRHLGDLPAEAFGPGPG